MEWLKEKTRDGLTLVVTLLCLLFFIVPLIMILDAFVSFFRDGADWLKTGSWPANTFWDGLHKWFLDERPSLGWVVPNNVLNWMLDGPRWVWMLVWAIVTYGAQLMLFIWVANWIEKLWNRWKARKENPLPRLSNRAKISLLVFAIWMLAFPTLMSGFRSDSGMWDDMFMVALVIAFYVQWPINAYLDRREKKQKAHEHG